MERLTKWNGSKYILPQGRTSEGESYWRIVADKLAEYENRDATERTMRYGFTDIMMPVETKSVEKFVRIWNDTCERIVSYWLNDLEWAVGFEQMKSEHWMFQDLGRQASAFFFMDMLDEAELAGSTFIYNFCKAEVERRKGVK